MSLSAAERQRQYRARRDADPERKAQNLNKDRNRWKKRLIAGHASTVAELGEREKRSKRRYWREAQQKCRTRKLRLELVEMTPPQSPELAPEQQTSRLDQCICP
ncbi:unnamed protein product [Boreogadus saida]